MKLGSVVRARGTRVIDHHFVATSQGKIGVVSQIHKDPLTKHEMTTVRWEDGTTFTTLTVKMLDFVEVLQR